jgi:hypothetical protein
MTDYTLELKVCRSIKTSWAFVTFDVELVKPKDFRNELGKYPEAEVKFRIIFWSIKQEHTEIY